MRFLLATFCLMLGVASARAAELCVTCAGPPVTYRCIFGDAVAASGDDPKAQMLCISELARFGGHESCAVDRRSAAACPGVLRAVSPQKEAPLAPLRPPPIGPAATPVPAGPHADTGPRTVEELAKQTAKSTGLELEKAGDTVKGTAKSAGEGIGKAGSAIGNAAKKSWHCLSTFFTDC